MDETKEDEEEEIFVSTSSRMNERNGTNEWNGMSKVRKETS